jgi:dTDP-4-dehydrorhamnose reductase
MIWLIGNRGMLGTDVERLLKERKLGFASSDLELDITDLNALQRYADRKSVEWIINCAAYTDVDKAEDEKDRAFSINADGSLNIARVAREIGSRLIHISTDYVFDGNKKEVYRESDPPNPQNVYGKSKLQGEIYIEQTTSNYFIIRTAWLYGMNGSNFVHTMLRLFNEKDTVKVVSDQWGSPTYTVDLAKAIITIIDKDSTEYGIYHFTNEGRTNWYELTKAIYTGAVVRGIAKREIEIVAISSKEYPTKTVRPQSSYLSKEKFRSTFEASIPTWQEGLEAFFSEFVRIQGAAQ